MVTQGDQTFSGEHTMRDMLQNCTFETSILLSTNATPQNLILKQFSNTYQERNWTSSANSGRI